MNLEGQVQMGICINQEKHLLHCDKSCTISSPFHLNKLMKDRSYSVVHTSLSTRSKETKFYIDTNTGLSLSSIKGRCLFVLLVKTWCTSCHARSKGTLEFSFPELRLNKFVKLVKNIKHWTKLWWRLNPGPGNTSLMTCQIGHRAFSLVPCIALCHWFCQIKLVEPICQKKAGVRES